MTMEELQVSVKRIGYLKDEAWDFAKKVSDFVRASNQITKGLRLTYNNTFRGLMNALKDVHN